MLSIILDNFRMDEKELHEKAMEAAIGNEKISIMEPVTERTVTKLSPDAFHISTQDFDTADQHVTILVRNPARADRWRLYSLCTRSRGGGTHYRIHGDEDNAIRKAKLIIDIYLGKIDVFATTEDDNDQDDNE